MFVFALASTLFLCCDSLQLTTPVFSAFSKYGEYYLNLSVGAQTFRVQIDTGSADLGIPQYGCTTCSSHDDKRYQPKSSPSAQPITCSQGKAMNLTCHPCHYHRQCAMSISYEDDSGFAADLWNDTVTFESYGKTHEITVQAVVGGLYKSNPKNPMQPKSIDGILGLAYSTVSSANTLTPLDYLLKQHANELDDVFALCLDSKKGGSFMIGSPDNNPYYESIANLQWTPLLKETYYPVDLQAIYVGDNKVDVAPAVYNRGDAIVDSGSTDITLPRAAYDAFRGSMQHQCEETTTNNRSRLVGVCVDEKGKKLAKGSGMFYGDCFTLSMDDILAFPTLTFQLGGGVRLPLKPNMYIRSGASYCDDLNQVTLAIDSGAVADGTLLGDVFMQSWLTIFDRKHKRVGFAPASTHC
jgi:hypothetical protein